MKNNKLWLILIVVVVLLAIGYLSMKGSGTKRSYLTGTNGMTLYTFDKDQPNVSNCSGGCAAIWPAYTTTVVPTLAAPWTVFTRPDGVIQYAYNGKPLYFYASDKKPGDVLGDGVNGIWHLVKP